MGIGKKIKEGREARKLSQRQLSEALGVSVQAVSNWENDRNDPGFARVNELSNILGVEISWLTGGQIDLNSDGFKEAYFNKDYVPVIQMKDAYNFSPTVSVRPLHEKSAIKTFLYPSVKIIGQGFAVEMPDKSMEPRITMRDQLIMDNGISADVGDLVIAFSFLKSTNIAIREISSYSEPFKNEPWGTLVCRAINRDPEFDDIVIGGKSGPGLVIATVVEHRAFPKVKSRRS